MQICAVIPAAGLGTRLGLSIPKILTPIIGQDTVWTILRNKLIQVVDHIHLIVSPKGAPLLRSIIKEDERQGLVSLSIQALPNGMGDAIFGCESYWRLAKTILVVWGDQVHVSLETLSRSLQQHNGQAHTVALPLIQMADPYVDYVFAKQKLKSVQQSREGERCRPVGLTDVGTFVLSVADLMAKWLEYQSTATQGAQTGEKNFLPFLPFLSQKNWNFQTVLVSDVEEARGINTMADLIFFKKLYTHLSENIL